MERAEAVHEQIIIRDRWQVLFRRWNRGYYCLGMIAIATSTLVASRPGFLIPQSPLYEWVAWSVALVTALTAFLKPDERSFRYRRAWSVLSIELARYRADETYTLNHVLGCLRAR
jgi:hypothetical protein